MAEKKFLDLDGVRTLWTAISQADDALTTATANLSTSKAGFIAYDEVNKKINLWASAEDANVDGKQPLSSIDASAFVKDGMLNSVEVVEASEDEPVDGHTNGTYIKFTWNTDSGKEESTIIEASKIGKIYNGSDSIEIDETTNAISVKEVDANITKTTRQMTVSSAIGDYKANTVIPEGTDIMAILANIFEKTLGIKTTQPSVSLSKNSGNDYGTYEYGSEINAEWSASLNPGAYTGDGWTTSQPTGVTAKTYTWSNASGTSNIGSVAISSLTSTTVVKCSISYDAGNMPKNNKGADLSGNRIAAGSKEATKTYTPKKYWWIGFSNVKYEDTTWDSDKVRALSLSKDWVDQKTKTVTFPAGAKQQVIAVPAGTTWTGKDGAGNDITNTFKTEDAPKQTISVTCGKETVSYDVYVAPANAGLEGDSKATITLG
jgi:hypothetical protein